MNTVLINTLHQHASLTFTSCSSRPLEKMWSMVTSVAAELWLYTLRETSQNVQDTQLPAVNVCASFKY